MVHRAGNTCSSSCASRPKLGRRLFLKFTHNRLAVVSLLALNWSNIFLGLPSDVANHLEQLACSIVKLALHRVVAASTNRCAKIAFKPADALVL